MRNVTKSQSIFLRNINYAAKTVNFSMENSGRCGLKQEARLTASDWTGWRVPAGATQRGDIAAMSLLPKRHDLKLVMRKQTLEVRRFYIAAGCALNTRQSHEGQSGTERLMRHVTLCYETLLGQLAACEHDLQVR